MKQKIIKIAEDLKQGYVTTKTARALLLGLFDVSGSLPSDDKIENKSIEYLDEKIFVSEDGCEHDTCREWAFIDGAIWMRNLLTGNDR